ncbi:MAG: TfuA-related McrA-glycine thioamidation protein [Methanophagales archaeon ANME-1-THS]|nr:MAG: TfuA-related McrA-glycine thioamidation protein [Methanophagales archaeon ANME-1-THS]
MHKSSIVVFLGPSLETEQARRIVDAEYRPPAARGDIFKAVKEGAQIIGLIDGVFFQACAIAHREILYALEKGVKVVGASSMGALRASELNVYGMEGIGRIYEQYKNGVLVSDDEVALLFEPESLNPLSEPLVNIRYNLERAEERGIITEEVKEKLVAIARSLYYPERVYERILSDAEGVVDQQMLEQLKKFLTEEKRDLKREDAIAALKRIKEIATGGVKQYDFSSR